jgi:hypothetical protein
MTLLQTILTMLLALGVDAGATYLPVNIQLHDLMMDGAKGLFGLAIAQHVNPLQLLNSDAKAPSILKKIGAAIQAALAALQQPPSTPPKA